MTIPDLTPQSSGRAARAVPFVVAVGDPEGTRTVWSIVVLLVVLGIGLVMLAVWLFRSTRPDKELLAPLEVMGERKWRRADPVWQRRKLDELRPPGAEPLQPSAAPPVFDEAFDRGPTASGFDDLHEDHDEPAGAEPAVDEEAEAEADSEAAQRDGATPPGGEPVVPAAAGDGATTSEDDDDSRPPVPDAREATEPAVRSLTAPTPIGIARPMEFSEREIDPDVLAAAVAELEAELGLRRDVPPDPPEPAN